MIAGFLEIIQKKAYESWMETVRSVCLTRTLPASCPDPALTNFVELEILFELIMEEAPTWKQGFNHCANALSAF